MAKILILSYDYDPDCLALHCLISKPVQADTLFINFVTLHSACIYFVGLLLSLFITVLLQSMSSSCLYLVKAGAACMNYNKSARGKYMTNSLYETKPFKMPGPLTKRCFACTFQEDVAKTCKIPTISYVRVRKMPNGEMVKLTNEGYSRTTYGGFYAK